MLGNGAILDWRRTLMNMNGAILASKNRPLCATGQEPRRKHDVPYQTTISRVTDDSLRGPLPINDYAAQKRHELASVHVCELVACPAKTNNKGSEILREVVWAQPIGTPQPRLGLLLSSK